MKDKLAFVCQRYGLEVNGGAELLCRQMAEQMTRYYDVEVYTTCAVDYVTWKNEYKPCVESINGVTVRRFKSKKERSQKSFGLISQRVLQNPNHSDKEEEKWLDEQGPVCPELLSELYEKQKQYKAILFMCYLYYHAARGLPMNFNRTILIPCAHDEPPVYLRCYDRVFNAADAFIWNMESEMRFAEKRFPAIRGKPGVVAGAGVEVPDGPLPEIPPSIRDVPYLVYAGRIDESKGCGEMFEYFRKYKERNGGSLKLVLMGKAVMKVPKADDIVELGFVSDELKFAVMANSVALTLFSKFESLSMIVLESMVMGRPVLVNGHCEVLKDHCTLSNAGFYFMNYAEFEAELDYLMTHEQVYHIMCKNGREYVRERYRWDVIVKKIRELIDEIS